MRKLIREEKKHSRYILERVRDKKED